MTTTLTVRFLLGRYHATPWGRHVNEGQVELPPSPWRLLRALYAVWQGRRPDLDPATVTALLDRLAEPPAYFVPAHTLAHTRHWYPDARHRTATTSTDRTLDAFAAVHPDQPLGIQWPFELPAEQEKALETLAESLPYLGRAESLCEARLHRLWEPPPGHTTWSPLDVSDDDLVPAATLLAPTLPLDLDALTTRPVDIRAGNRLLPAHTRAVPYAVTGRSAPPADVIARPRIEVFRFTITNRVRPPHADAVAIADLVRTAALSRLDRQGTDRPESLLAGRHADRAGGGPLAGKHHHTHYLCLPDDDRLLGEILVWTPAGLDPDEADAIGTLREIHDPTSDRKPITVRLAGYGDTADVLDDLAGPARTWRSVTPFVTPRHGRGIDFLKAEIVRELAHRDLPPAEAIGIDGDWRSFTRFRPTRRFARTDPDPRSARPGTGWQLAFPEPVTGPIALGHLSHFGLGLFLPDQR